MSTTADSEIVAQHARLVYGRQLRGKLERENPDEFVASEPESDEYFLGRTLSEAIQAARRAHPERLPLAMRVRRPTGVQIGMGSGNVSIPAYCQPRSGPC